VLEVEFFGSELLSGGPSLARLSSLCAAAATAAGVTDGHVAIQFVDERRIAQLNASHRGHTQPTDVLSFPIDGVEPLHAGGTLDSDGARTGNGGGLPTRELGDVVICPAHASDLSEAVVHGMLHLLGMDHETDTGEMLSLQHELLQREAP
jgi:probable rRNA maturation factor